MMQNAYSYLARRKAQVRQCSLGPEIRYLLSRRWRRIDKIVERPYGMNRRVGSYLTMLPHVMCTVITTESLPIDGA